MAIEILIIELLHLLVIFIRIEVLLEVLFIKRDICCFTRKS